MGNRKRKANAATHRTKLCHTPKEKKETETILPFRFVLFLMIDDKINTVTPLFYLRLMFIHRAHSC